VVRWKRVAWHPYFVVTRVNHFARSCENFEFGFCYFTCSLALSDRERIGSQSLKSLVDKTSRLRGT